MYTTYFLKFATQEEAEQKLTEVGYAHTYETTETQLVRTRDELGQYVGDDPETPEDEAWEEVTVTKTSFSPPPHTGDVDIIGDIYESYGTYDEEGNELTPAVKLPGYHINIILNTKLPEELNEFLVHPQHPYRVFA